MVTVAELPSILSSALTSAPDASSPARFGLLAADEERRAALAARLVADLAPLAPVVRPLSDLDRRMLVLAFPGRTFGSFEAAFDAAYALADTYALESAEPDLATDLFPESEPRSGRFGDESFFGDFPPWCWGPEQAELNDDPLWALRQIRVVEAWAYSRQQNRPAGGRGVLIAQPDTGLTPHPELAGLDRAPGHDFVDDDADSTDPMNYSGNPGHGTGTASVVAAPGRQHLSGSAPAARLMPIRAIESVVRISQVSVAEAIDFAVASGAQVITMSLGGLPSLSLNRALRRAVAADVIVLAAAGNCVGEVVFPARYEDCIAVAGTDWKDQPWRGSCRGEAVSVSAPGENVFRARANPDGPSGDYGQGQGTSFAVALVAGVAALWLAHHGRANLVAAARADGETLQAAFRRLLRATARRPDDWDTFNMGAGVVDALQLLRADFSLGRDLTESITASETGQPGVPPVRSLLVSTFGEQGDPPGLDWTRYGQELALAALRTKLPPRPASQWGWESPAPAPAFSARLRDELAGTGLQDRLQPPPPPVAPAPADADAPGGFRHEYTALSGPFSKLLARGGARGPSGLRTESAEPRAEGVILMPGAHPDDVLGQVEDVLKRMPEEEVPDPEAFRRALTLLLSESEGPVRRYAAAPHLAPPRQDRMALEAIIRADGSRPSLLLRDGRANPDHPLARDWADTLRGVGQGDLIRERAMAVGAVDATDPAKRRPYYGTGWLVEAGRGLVITNLHVLLALREDLGHLFLPGTAPGHFRVRPGVIIDFSRESNRPNRPPFRVVEATASGIDGDGFRRLDLAVLRIEPDEGQTLPFPIPVRADFDVPNGNRSFCTIGYPGPPDQVMTSDGRVNWGWVTATLFGSTFGVKRLAPGLKYRDLGSLGGDPQGWVFGHDATTLSGSSGSPLVDWLKDGAGVGLHFAGHTLETNVAHALARCGEQLRKLGVPVQEE